MFTLPDITRWSTTNTYDGPEHEVALDTHIEGFDYVTVRMDADHNVKQSVGFIPKLNLWCEFCRHFPYR